jgi:hypothetical protein
MSELQNILRHIDLEVESMQRGLHGLAAGSARHDFIQARLENMSRAYEKLVPIVGSDNACGVLSHTMERMHEEVQQMEVCEMQRTQRLPAVHFSLKYVMEAFQLNTAIITREAGVPGMTLWRAMRGLPVTPAHAQAIVHVILRATGLNLTGTIPTVEH